MVRAAGDQGHGGEDGRVPVAVGGNVVGDLDRGLVCVEAREHVSGDNVGEFGVELAGGGVEGETITLVVNYSRERGNLDKLARLAALEIFSHAERDVSVNVRHDGRGLSTRVGQSHEQLSSSLALQANQLPLEISTDSLATRRLCNILESSAIVSRRLGAGAYEQGLSRLEDGAVDDSLAAGLVGGVEVGSDGSGAGGLAVEGDAVGVASEGFDVVVDPLNGGVLVAETGVGVRWGEGGGAGVAKEVQAVVEGYKDGAGVGEGNGGEVVGCL